MPRFAAVRHSADAAIAGAGLRPFSPAHPAVSSAFAAHLTDAARRLARPPDEESARGTPAAPPPHQPRTPPSAGGPAHSAGRVEWRPAPRGPVHPAHQLRP